uniref:Uncharacterized protein n=1 Tax=Physcomitrium patens TaxID=3218 RepID=A0A2K1IUA9_PHYPA|nr:hypothetical protein PHYPA_024808 [Physcomitrium patens]
MSRPERLLSSTCTSRSSEGTECVHDVGFHKCPKEHISINPQFDVTTVSEYRANYTKLPMPEKPHRRAPPRDTSNAKIAHATTYSGDYVNHPHNATSSRRRPPSIQSRGPFQQETTYNFDYRDKSAQMERSVRTPWKSPEIGDKFSGESVYTTEFRNHGCQRATRSSSEARASTTRR